VSQDQVYTNIYDLDYFSGAQMFLYIGDVWVDEVTGLQYTTQQVKTPIYGYASQLYDDCTAGHVIVQGNFAINFKEAGYLWAVLRRWHQLGADAGAFPVSQSDSGLSNGRTTEFNRPVKGANATKIRRQSIESITQGNATRGETYEFYQGLAGYATTQVRNARDVAFENVMEAFEDAIWMPKTTNNVLNSQIRSTDSNEFDGFDIFVVFGNYATPGANHTVQKIIDVRLQSQGKMIKIDGEPIQETYSFIARSTV